MVRCPRGTRPQLKANFEFSNRYCITIPETFSWEYNSVTDQMIRVEEDVEEEVEEESIRSDYDSIKVYKRTAPSSRGDLVYLFIGFFMDVLLESWDGKPCMKQRFEVFSTDIEEPGESDLIWIPCESSSSSSAQDALKKVYQKRSQSLLKTRFSQSNEKLSGNKSLEYSEYEYENENEEEFEYSEPTDLINVFVPDEEVHFVFRNGVWYKGRVSKRLMDGDGIYFWEDGSHFEGKFEAGCITGKGRLEFSDLSVYEGDLYKAFRHGEGMFCFSDSPVMYTGQWWLGKKHGEGLIVYNDPSTSIDFYNGCWVNGVKEGFGMRQYPSGAKYIGEWSGGLRHGKGVLLWTNNDIYRGEWKNGLMDGYGEYTWNGFVNKTFCYYASNTYRGYWSEGKRCGQGVLEVKNGATIDTVWVDDVKEGPGTVICCNGTVVTADRLFHNDKQAVLFNKEDNIGMLIREQTCHKKRRKRFGKADKKNNKEQLMTFLSRNERKTVSIPIHASIYSLNLDPHVQKYNKEKKTEISQSFHQTGSSLEMIRSFEERQKRYDSEDFNFTPDERSKLTLCTTREKNQLKNSIIANMTVLKDLYHFYATLACEKSPQDRCVLLRIFLWQMLIDGDVPQSDFSLIDIDNMLAEEKYLLFKHRHDPFERIQMWQFIHILICLSWEIYGRKVFIKDPLVVNQKVFDFVYSFQNFKPNYVLKQAFEHFLTENLLNKCFEESSTGCSEKKFQESDFAPMEAMYKIYREVGEPHSARELVNVICSKTKDKEVETIAYFEKIAMYKVKGKNVLTVAGELNYLPGKKDFNFPQIIDLQEEQLPKCQLKVFQDLGARRVIECLGKVCPGVQSDGCIINIDYQLTFLEFYKVIILCTEAILKLRMLNEMKDDIIKEFREKMEEYNRFMNEYEKAKEGTPTSTKKSRQVSVSEYSKKGKKL